MNMFTSLMEVKNKLPILLQDGRLEEAETLIVDNHLLDSTHAEIVNTLASIYVSTNRLDAARAVLERGIKKHEFHADMNFNLGYVYFEMGGNDEKALWHFQYFCQLNPKESESAKPYLDDLKERMEPSIYEQVFYRAANMFVNLFLAFPGGGPLSYESLYIGSAFQIHEQSYFVGSYVHQNIEVQPFTMPRENQGFSVKIMPAEKVKEFTYTCQTRTSIPIMTLSHLQKVTISDGEQDFETLLHTSTAYHYFTFSENKRVTIRSDAPFVVGKPISLQTANQTKPKLILNLFVDGLSQFFLNEAGFERLMPNTAHFFKKGTIFTDAHATGEWTYTSAAGYFTGKYTMNHRVFHPNFSTEVLYDQVLFPEIFQKAGYHCMKIDGNWRTLPIAGYVKGVDQTVYHHSRYGFGTAETIREAIEHLYALSDNSNFVWLWLPDLHDIADEQYLAVGPQIHLDAENQIVEKTTEKSTRKSFSSRKMKRYEAQIKRLDMLLNTLYHFVEDHYSDDEIIVSLFSDHGQSFLKDTENFLDEHRTHVPFMLRGKNIPAGTCDALVQSIDLFPTILHTIDVPSTHPHDGNVPTYFGGARDREYVLTESLYPGSPYRMTFIEKEYKICFESMNGVTKDGQIPIHNGFRGKILERKTDADVTQAHLEKIKQYEAILLHHIMDYCI